MSLSAALIPDQFAAGDPAAASPADAGDGVNDQFPSGFWSTDAELRLTSTHSPWMALAGTDTGSLIGLQLDQLPGGRAGLRAIGASRRALKGQDARFVASWGGRTWEGHVQPLRAGDGAIIGTIGFALDATERERATRELREGEARFRSVFEQAVVGISMCDPTGRYVRVNPKVCEMFGYTQAEMLGSSYQAMTPPDEVATNDNLNERLFAGEIASFQLEKPVIHRDGHPVWIRLTASAIRDTDGTPLYGLGIIEDISAQKAAEQALQQSLEQYRLLFESALDAVLVLDDESCIVDANQQACELYGRPRAEIVGHSIYEFEAQADRLPDQDADWQSFIKAGEWRGEVQITRPDGTVRDVEFSSRAHFAPGRHLSFGRDVTDRRRLEEMLSQSQKLEAIGRLAGGIAHDFNNLLTAILGYTEIIASDPATGHLKEELDVIEGAARRAADLTRQLLAFSRRQILRPVPLDLNEVVAGMEPILRRIIGEDIEPRRRPPARAAGSCGPHATGAGAAQPRGQRPRCDAPRWPAPDRDPRGLRAGDRPAAGRPPGR